MVVNLIPIGKFMIDLTENMKRLLDTYQEIRPDNFNFSFDTVQNHYVATKLYLNSFLDYNRFQQMFYMIITANICILK